MIETTMDEVLETIKEMAGEEMWSRTFVAKCLRGFEQCLKTLNYDYEMIDALTLSIWEKYDLPDVSLVTDSKIIGRFGKAGQEALDEVD